MSMLALNLLCGRISYMYVNASNLFVASFVFVCLFVCMFVYGNSVTGSLQLLNSHIQIKKRTDINYIFTVCEEYFIQDTGSTLSPRLII
jgi:hypothetical protein